jgi:polyphosphate kinase 2 (PPK2 family)
MNHKSKPNGIEKMKARKYEKGLRKLQGELCRLQEWIEPKGRKFLSEKY